jgi:hypothetical protein
MFAREFFARFRRLNFIAGPLLSLPALRRANPSDRMLDVRGALTPPMGGSPASQMTPPIRRHGAARFVRSGDDWSTIHIDERS